MARYQLPPDPRKSDEKRPRRLRADSSPPMPWRYLLLGVVVTVVSIIMALALVNAMLARPPLEVSPVQPTLIILTAPPSAVPSATSILPTPSVIPTFTPIPTPDHAFPPDVITVNYYATVANTGGVGVVVRGGPGTLNAQITLADDGVLLLVIGGPEADEANNRVWWQVELSDGTRGWVAGDFLLPAAGP